MSSTKWKWFRGVVYDVVLEGETKGVMGGSTENLHRRCKEYRYEKSWFGNGRLIPVRVVEGYYVDREQFLGHLRAVEFFHILNNGYFDSGYNKANPLLWLSGRPEDRVRELCRIGGRAAGCEAFKKKTGFHAPGFGEKLRTREHQQRAGRAGGLITGRKNAETGQIHALGRKNVESGHLARQRTSEHQTIAGRIGGRIGGLIGGPIRGRKHKENGTGICAPGIAAKGGRIGGCLRWNVRRSKPCTCGEHVQRGFATIPPRKYDGMPQV